MPSSFRVRARERNAALTAPDNDEIDVFRHARFLVGAGALSQRLGGLLARKRNTYYNTYMTRYSCSFTTTGNSKALRLDAALIAAHPEFGERGPATATVIAPGRMLVSVPPPQDQPVAEDDPIFGAFLHLLAEDIAKHPERLGAVDDELIARAAALTAGVSVNDDEVLPDDVTL